MPTDTLLQELRNLRHQIEAECENDPKKYYEHLLSIQEQHKKSLVCRKPAAALQQSAR